MASIVAPRTRDRKPLATYAQPKPSPAVAAGGRAEPSDEAAGTGTGTVPVLVRRACDIQGARVGELAAGRCRR